MSGHWEQREDLLAAIAADDLAHDDGGIAPTLLALDADDTGVLVRARRPRHHDRSDPVSELAAYVAARRPPRVALAVAGEVQGGHEPGLETHIGPALACSTAEWSQGRWTHRLRILTDPFGAGDRPGGRMDADISGSPLGVLLDDALRHPVSMDAWVALALLAALGHTVHVAPGTVLPDDLPDPEQLAHWQHRRLESVAIELGRRSAPRSASGEQRRLPAVLSDIPPGWQAACPL